MTVNYFSIKKLLIAITKLLVRHNLSHERWCMYHFPTNIFTHLSFPHRPLISLQPLSNLPDCPPMYTQLCSKIYPIVLQYLINYLLEIYPVFPPAVGCGECLGRSVALMFASNGSPKTIFGDEQLSTTTTTTTTSTTSTTTATTTTTTTTTATRQQQKSFSVRDHLTN